MRARLPLAAAVLAAIAAPAAVAAAPSPAPAGDAATVPAAQAEDLRERLLAAQQTIATLERRLADEQNRAVALETCRVKNGRLVAIGKQLIEGYERRYRLTHNDPLQLGRRRFEFELQTLSEAIYRNLADVPEPPAAAPGGQPVAAGVPLAPPEILPPPPDRMPPAPVRDRRPDKSPSEQ